MVDHQLLYIENPILLHKVLDPEIATSIDHNSKFISLLIRFASSQHEELSSRQQITEQLIHQLNIPSTTEAGHP